MLAQDKSGRLTERCKIASCTEKADRPPTRGESCGLWSEPSRLKCVLPRVPRRAAMSSRACTRCGDLSWDCAKWSGRPHKGPAASAVATCGLPPTSDGAPACSLPGCLIVGRHDSDHLNTSIARLPRRDRKGQPHLSPSRQEDRIISTAHSTPGSNPKQAGAQQTVGNGGQPRSSASSRGCRTYHNALLRLGADLRNN